MEKIAARMAKRRDMIRGGEKSLQKRGAHRRELVKRQIDKGLGGLLNRRYSNLLGNGRSRR